MIEHTQAYLKQVFTYSPCDGLFRWRYGRKGTRAGKVAGTIGKDRYRIIMLDGKNYYTHRLAWFYVLGKWPDDDLDHIDTIRSNECFFNLREATRQENMQNSRLRMDNMSGFKGVSFHSNTLKWRANIRDSNKKQIHLGLFNSRIDAAKAYNEEAVKLFGKFARLNKINTEGT